MLLNACPVKSSIGLADLINSINPQHILFILDGYDEFATKSLYKNVIKSRLLNDKNCFNVILTSRTYKIPPNFDAIIESTGLTSENILPYLKVCNPQNAGAIWEYIEKNPVVHKLAQIPLLLELISQTWQELLKNTNSITQTELFETIHNKMSLAFIDKQKLRIPVKEPEKINEKLENAEAFTAEAAFRGMENSNTLIPHSILLTTKEHCNFKSSDLNSLLEPGFIHGPGKTNNQRQYYFPHLTFREYWAAVFLANLICRK